MCLRGTYKKLINKLSQDSNILSCHHTYEHDHILRRQQQPK